MFTYYIITEGEGGGGVSERHDYREGGLALWWHKQISFLQSEVVFELSPKMPQRHYMQCTQKAGGGLGQWIET